MMGYDSCMKSICKLLLSLILLNCGFFVLANEQVVEQEQQPVVTSVEDVAVEEQPVAISEEVVSEAVNALKPITLVKNHPIDVQEANCRAVAQDTAQTVDCVAKSIQYWAYETSKYYSLLHKKLKGDDKTAIYESQKYWNLYKNNDFKVVNSLYSAEEETPERLILQAEQKRDVIKNRAVLLHSYYVQSFPETDNPDEKIPVNSVYKPDNFVIRALRYIGF